MTRPILLAIAATLGSACAPGEVSTQLDAGGPSVPPPIDVSFEQRLDAFQGDPIPSPPDVFSMMLGDMDQDGDLDYFLNRHNLVPMRVFENLGGTFVQVNRRGLDRSGVYENAGVPDLYAKPGVMLDAIVKRGTPGIHVWYGPKKDKGRWHFYLLPEEQATPMSFRLTTNRKVKEVDLPQTEFTQVDDFTIDVHPQDPGTPRRFTLSSNGNQLEIEKTAACTLPIVVGPAFAVFTRQQISLWKRDPHGMALVDAVGSALPDLFVTQGGLTGNLQPPHDPKTDQLFEYLGGSSLYREVPPGTIPSGFGRGRRVAWCDIDADGQPELYTSNRETPNTLYDLDATGSLVDRAPELGLDLEGPVACAWLDVDGDGMLDLVFVEDQALSVAYNRPHGFLITDGSELGLVLPSPPGEPNEGLFDPCALQIADIDRDGDLDLWVTSYDSSAQARVYRRVGHGFLDVSEETGIAAQGDFSSLMIADVDNDGWIDLITPRETVHDFGPVETYVEWWRNLGGERFERARLEPDFPEDVSKQATAGDVDGDGWIDLVVMTDDQRQLLINTSVGPNRLLEVHPGQPLGTLIRAYYQDGSAQVQQLGAATVSPFAQSLQPLRFGMGPLDRIVELGVQLPGDASESYRVEVPRGATDVDL